MYCPDCGSPQTLKETRCCPDCGFLLEVVRAVVNNRGVMPRRRATDKEDAEPGEIVRTDDYVKIPFPTAVGEAERHVILGTLNKMGGNKTRAAEVLEISLKTLHNKLRVYKNSRIE